MRSPPEDTLKLPDRRRPSKEDVLRLVVRMENPVHASKEPPVSCHWEATDTTPLDRGVAIIASPDRGASARASGWGHKKPNPSNLMLLFIDV
jgi:hypothetical protein